VRWNQDACRNIGVHHAETEWLLLTDMDHLVPEATWRRCCCASMIRQGLSLLARLGAGHAALQAASEFLVHDRAMFERAGGYDENFAGLYGTDAMFRDQVRKAARDRDAEGRADPLSARGDPGCLDHDAICASSRRTATAWRDDARRKTDPDWKPSA
jgi:hypothetical protein